MSPHLLSGAARLAGSSLLRLQSDERLVALVRDGHAPAFEAVVERYRPELLRYCSRIVGESRAEDVVQQALLNAHGAMTSSPSDIRLRPWLYRIAHNAGLNVLRANRAEYELDERLATAGSVAESAETNERLRDALAAISKLPEPQRDALTLRALEGRSHDEIATALGVSPGAARQHLHRARVSVRAAVSAVTPYGLMARFAMAGGSEPATTSLLSGAGAGAGAVGIGATVTKIGAGVLAAGAIATGTTGHVPFTGGGHADRPAAATASEPAPREAPGPTPEAVGVPAADDSRDSQDERAQDDGNRRGRGQSGRNGRSERGRDDDSSGHRGSGSGEADDDGREASHSGRDDSEEHSGSGTSGSRDDDTEEHSGSDTSGSRDDDTEEHSGSDTSGSRDDHTEEHSGSGTSGSDSESHDDALDGVVVADDSRDGDDELTEQSSDSGSSGSGSSSSGATDDELLEIDDD